MTKPTALLSATLPLLQAVTLAACSASVEAGPAHTPKTASPSADGGEACTDADAGTVFVSPIGDDAAPGTRDAPVRTFAHAIDLARGSDRRLALCSGVFTEPLVLSAALGADGFSVEGSAACQGLSSSRTIVRSAHGPALEIFAVGGRVSIEDVDFAREDALEPGESAVAASIAFAEDVTLEGVALRAGTGAAGARGARVRVDPCDEPIDPRVVSHVGHTGSGARRLGELSTTWEPGAGESGGVLRFPRSSRCVEPSVEAGAGGSGGGASIALTARASHVTLANATLESATAGDGGDGGAAQPPACDPLAQKSCEVLDIGGGGGGAGGVSAAIVHRQAVFDIDPATKLLFGAPGKAGAGGRGARWLHGTSGISGIADATIGAELLDDPAPSPAAPDPRR